MNSFTLRTTVLAGVCGLVPFVGMGSLASAQECVVDFDFDSSVGNPGLQEGIDPAAGYIHSIQVFDDGSGTGPALFASGSIDNTGGAQIRAHLAKWDGSQWNEVFPALFDGSAKVMIVHDDGTGEVMYFGGFFSSVGFFEDANAVAKWDGTTFTGVGPQGPGVNGFTHIGALAIFDDGTGEKLYVGGNAPDGNGPGASDAYSAVWKLDNNEWIQVGQELGLNVEEMKVFDDGNGERLYVGGSFGGVSSAPHNLAVLGSDGQWESVGGVEPNGSVFDMEVWDDGDGPALYISGIHLGFVGGLSTRSIAKWDGTQWSALGSVGTPGDGVDNGIFDMAIWDDGTGEALYVTGPVYAESAPGDNIVQRVSSIAKWNGQSWSATVPNTRFNSYYTGIGELIIGHDDGNGPGLFVAGTFDGLTRDVDGQPVYGGNMTHVAVVRGCSPAGCPADLTGDGQLDFFDVSAFLTAFSANDPTADFTGDGAFDFFDVSAFLTAFSEGCP